MSARQLRFVLPIRTSKRKKEAKSPDQQRDLAFAWKQAHGHEIVAVLDSGRDESGKTMDRETIRQAMAMVRAGEADGIVFALTDRLGRAPIEESMAWIRKLNLVGHLALADAGGDPVNLGDPNAETALVLQLQIARQYWLAAARRFRQSQRDAVKAGKFIGKTPLGFRRERGHLYEDAHTGPIITEAYRIASGDGLAKAVSYLKQAVPERKWNTDHVRRLLASRAYLGENRYVLADDPGNFTAETLVSPIAHDALTDLSTWTAAQTDAKFKRASGDYPLTHQVHCGRCHWGLVGALQSVHGYTYRRMRCSNPACKGGCSINADKLEAYVHEALTTPLLSDPAWRAQFGDDGLAGAQAALKAAQANRTALTHKVQPSDPDFEVWKAKADAEVAVASEAFQAASAKAHQAKRLPLPEELSDPEQFARGLRAVTSLGRILIEPGRGAVDVRTSYVPFGDDDEARVLAA